MKSIQCIRPRASRFLGALGRVMPIAALLLVLAVCPAIPAFAQATTRGADERSEVDEPRAREPVPPASGHQLFFYPLPDGTARKAALRDGTVAVLPIEVSPDLSVREIVSALEDDPNVHITGAPGPRLFHVGINMRAWPLSDRDMRQALALAIDRQSLAELLFGEFAFPASGFLPEFDPFFDPEVRPLQFDPDRAAERLERSGFTLEEGPTRLDPRSEQPLQPLTLLAPREDEAPMAHEAAVFVADAVAAVGIPVELTALPWHELEDRVYRFDFDLYALSWEIPSQPTFLYSLFHSSQDVGGGLNLSGIRRGDLDGHLYMLRAAGQRDEARKAAWRVQRLLRREMPMIPLFHVPVLTAIRTDLVQGLEPMPRFGAADYRHRRASLHLRWTGDIADGEPPVIGWATPPLDQEPLNPWRDASSAVWTVLGRVYEPLWSLDPHTLEPIPWLAERWETDTVTDENGLDATRITFHLREDVQWHDGMPLTADDVRFTLERAKEGVLPGYPGLEAVRAIETDGDYAVTVEFHGPSHWHFHATDVPIIPRHLWEHEDDPAAIDAVGSPHPWRDDLTLAVGTGPYIVQGGGEGAPYRLVRFLEYKEPLPEKEPAPAAHDDGDGDDEQRTGNDGDRDAEREENGSERHGYGNGDEISGSKRGGGTSVGVVKES